MSTTIIDISVSLDGFVAGPDPTLEEPLGRGGELLHEWAFATRGFQETHGRDATAAGTSVEDGLVAEHLARTGATVMGRRMFSGGEGPWEDDPRARGWWGDDPPFHHPVFVLTHHPREPLEMEGGTTFTFVTAGIEAAVAMAHEAAGGKDVLVAGGAQAVQQALAAGLATELQLHVAPVLLGSGRRLLEHLGATPPQLERTRVVEGERATHLRFAVRR
jgi:dihydrofolate reductase